MADLRDVKGHGGPINMERLEGHSPAVVPVGEPEQRRHAFERESGEQCADGAQIARHNPPANTHITFGKARHGVPVDGREHLKEGLGGAEGIRENAHAHAPHGE